MAGSGDAILVIDSGTTSTRAILFGLDGSVLAAAQQDITQHYPRPGWVEHDAAQIWELTLSTMRDAVKAAGGPGRIVSLGITNQRETVVAWDRQSGEPLHHAIVWQDRRTAGQCRALQEAGHEARVQEQTGLRLDPYFSATKMRWLLDNSEAVGAAARSGRLAFGTIESWLAFKLTGQHVSDASNASRTSLLPLHGKGWDHGLCELFGVPVSSLPQIVDTCGVFGHLAPEILGADIPVSGMAGDQQAATIGQGCLKVGETKATFGTGAFVLSNMGETAPLSDHRLLTTVLHQVGGQRQFALEGSIFVAGSLLKWLRDNLGIIASAAESEALARSVPDSGGVTIVPALSGLGAPHWLPEVRGQISGLSFATGRSHIARAALEAMAFQMHDLARAFAADGAPWSALKIDGGMSTNDWLAQDLSDLLNLPVERPDHIETTALGAAVLSGVGAGLFGSLADAVHALRGDTGRFEPALDQASREARLAQWASALEAVGVDRA